MPRLFRSGLSTLRYVFRALGGFGLILNLVGVVTVAIAAAHPTSRAADVLTVTAAVLVVGRLVVEQVTERDEPNRDRLLMGTKTLVRILVVAAALAIDSPDNRDGWVVTTAVVLMALLVGEGAVRRPVKGAAPQAAHFPGAEVHVPSTTIANWYFVATTAAAVLLAAAAAIELTQVPALVVTVAALALALVVGAQSARYLVGRNRVESALPSLLEQLAPAFAFHWQAPIGTAYQASMWLPYLERLGVPYFVLVRTPANFHEVASMTSAPVILRAGLEDLDAVVCPSLKTVFYANTAVRNSHMIRFPHLTHIQLNHGDSDKIASVSPTFRQYDKNFVAGQAAIDRFAQHGVSTLPDQFEIVGRPQLENVEQAAGPIGAVDRPTVLYCPTWSGFYDDSDYSSLSAGTAIVRALTDRGCTVVFRPHPYARRHPGNARACDAIIDLLTRDHLASGREHVFGAAAETGMSVVDCFNASDAMVSDVSSVVSDYLIANKPFAMAAVSAHGEEFITQFPLARAAYVFDVRGNEAAGLDAVLDDMLGEDSRSGPRRDLRTYYLSDTPPDRITERFLEVARRYL